MEGWGKSHLRDYKIWALSLDTPFLVTGNLLADLAFFMLPLKKNHRIALIIVLFILTLGFASLSLDVHDATARPLNWVTPQRIPGYDDDSLDPVLVKSNQEIHAFNTKVFGETRVIIYSQWTLNRGWTTPNDILISPLLGQLDVLDVYLDTDGIFHLIYYAGDDTLANIYYSQASIWTAGMATAWSKPVIIGEKAITPFEGQITRDAAGNLIVLYSGNYDGNGIYAISSADNGRTWSTEPVSVLLTFNDEHRPYSLKMVMDEDKRLHAVWSVVDINGEGQAVYYANREADNLQWSRPFTIATGVGLGSDTPALAAYRGNLFVIYHNDFPTTRWMRRSLDMGRTWQDPVRLFQHVGSNGPASLVVDSNDRLHMFFGNRRGDPAIHGMWTTTWLGSRWEEPIAVVSGSRISDDVGGRGFDPSFANAAILQGNLLFLSWRTDPGAGTNGIWFTYNMLDAPLLPTYAYPTPTATIEIVPSATPTSLYNTPTPGGSEPTAEFSRPASGRAPIINPGVWVAISILPAMVVITAVVVVLRTKSNKTKNPRRP